MNETEQRLRREERQRKRFRKNWELCARAAARKARRISHEKEQLRKKQGKSRSEQDQEELPQISLKSENPSQKQVEVEEQTQVTISFLRKLLRKSEKRAQIAKYLFDIDIFWLKERLVRLGYTCEICGGQLEFKSREKNKDIKHIRLFREFPWNASLDQVIHGRGYTKENVQVTHVTCNLSKLDMEMREFVELCDRIVQYNTEKKESGKKVSFDVIWPQDGSILLTHEMKTK